MRLLACAGMVLVLVSGCVSVDVSGLKCNSIEVGVDAWSLYTNVDCSEQPKEDDENETTD